MIFSDLDLLNEESFRQGKQGCLFHHSLSLTKTTGYGHVSERDSLISVNWLCQASED